MTKTPAKSAVTRQDRADVTATAHHFYKKTGLSWSVCMLAAWQAWRDQKAAQLRETDGGADTYAGARQSDMFVNPYELKDAEKAKRATTAWWAVYAAM